MTNYHTTPADLDAFEVAEEVEQISGAPRRAGLPEMLMWSRRLETEGARGSAAFRLTLPVGDRMHALADMLADAAMGIESLEGVLIPGAVPWI